MKYILLALLLILDLGRANVCVIIADSTCNGLIVQTTNIASRRRVASARQGKVADNRQMARNMARVSCFAREFPSPSPVILDSRFFFCFVVLLFPFVV
jgi:hypothetical protein